MKLRHYLFTGVASCCLMLLASCSQDEPQPVEFYQRCPPDPIPLGGTPPVAANLPCVSFDRRYIAWITGRWQASPERLWLLDRSTGAVRELDIPGLLPQPTFIHAIAKLLWSPYPSSRLLVDCVVGTDTLGNGEGLSGGHQVFIIDVETDSIRNATPIQYGRGGGDFAVYDWLPGSTPERDSILTGIGTVVMPSRHLVPSSYPWVFRVGPGWAVLSSRQLGSDAYQFTLNGRDVQGAAPHRGGGSYPAWTPNGRLCAISTSRGEDWITYVIDVHQNQVIAEINLVKDCIYPSEEVDFLTDSSLVLYMRPAGVMNGRLVECSFTGQVIRDLWFF